MLLPEAAIARAAPFRGAEHDHDETGLTPTTNAAEPKQQQATYVRDRQNTEQEKNRKKKKLQATVFSTFRDALPSRSPNRREGRGEVEVSARYTHQQRLTQGTDQYETACARVAACLRSREIPHPHMCVSYLAAFLLACSYCCSRQTPITNLRPDNPYILDLYGVTQSMVLPRPPWAHNCRGITSSALLRVSELHMRPGKPRVKRYSSTTDCSADFTLKGNFNLTYHANGGGGIGGKSCMHLMIQSPRPPNRASIDLSSSATTTIYVSRPLHCAPELANDNVFPGRGDALAVAVVTLGTVAAECGTNACTPRREEEAISRGRTTLLTLLRGVMLMLVL